MRTSNFDTRIRFERATQTRDLENQVVESWALLVEAKAAVRWGRGSERAEAAATTGVQVGTFIVRATPGTRDVGLGDRIVGAGATWNIIARAEPHRHELHFTASMERRGG
jgi:head-tail adaptor